MVDESAPALLQQEYARWKEVADLLALFWVLFAAGIMFAIFQTCENPAASWWEGTTLGVAGATLALITALVVKNLRAVQLVVPHLGRSQVRAMTDEDILATLSAEPISLRDLIAKLCITDMLGARSLQKRLETLARAQKIDATGSRFQKWYSLN